MLGGPERVDSLAAERQIGFKMKDVVWDAALVYAPGVKWGSPAEQLVAPVFQFPIHLSQIDHTVSTVAWVMEDVSRRRRSSQARP
jgi:hypothetical protein